MKTIEQYQCEYCGERYDIECDCVLCESTHISPINITNEIYSSRIRSQGMGHLRYPSYIDITMSDDTVVRYEYLKEISQ